MTKIISPSGWDFGCPSASLLKVAANGVRGNDRREFVKRAGEAGANIFLPMLDQVKFARDEVPMHAIALGAEEYWGGNRNGDAFTEDVLKEAYDSFTKYARFFRNHKNKPHEGHNHYGRIKLAAYNPEMHRVELLCGLFGTKEAAERDGDSLARVADRELEKLASGKDLALSMACRVPYDVCTACHNKARTREEYCKSASCPAGGCYDNLSRLVKIGSDVHHVRVRNVRPIFFDFSDVFRPAERTGYGNKADYLTKMADDHGYSDCGNRAAENLGVSAPLSVIAAGLDSASDRSGQIKLAYALDRLERTDDKAFEARLAFAPAVQPPIDLAALGLDPTSPVKMAAGLGAMADRTVILPLRDFARMTKRADHVVKAAQALPGVYGRMIDDGSLDRRVLTSPYDPAEQTGSLAQRTRAIAVAPEYTLEKSAVARRVALAVVRGVTVSDSESVFWSEKQAADAPEAEDLARDYAVYKLAALQRIAGFDVQFPLTCRIASCQNQVS